MEQALISGVEPKLGARAIRVSFVPSQYWAGSRSCPASAPGGLGNDAGSKCHGLGVQELF